MSWELTIPCCCLYLLSLQALSHNASETVLWPSSVLKTQVYNGSLHWAGCHFVGRDVVLFVHGWDVVRSDVIIGGIGFLLCADDGELVMFVLSLHRDLQWGTRTCLVWCSNAPIKQWCGISALNNSPVSGNVVRFFGGSFTESSYFSIPASNTSQEHCSNICLPRSYSCHSWECRASSLLGNIDGFLPYFCFWIHADWEDLRDRCTLQLYWHKMNCPGRIHSWSV